MVVSKCNHPGPTLEAAMPSLTIKNVPEDVHRSLKRQAEVHRRSLNQEILDVLSREARRVPLDVEMFLEDLQRLHGRMKGRCLPAADIDAAKREGRP